MGLHWVLLFLACVSCIHGQCPVGYDCSGMCDALSTGNFSSNNATVAYGNVSAIVLPCPTGFLCYADQYPERCPRGHYCPNATTAIDCPSGHYCGKGSSFPRNCPGGAVCPKGSWKYVHILGIFVLLAEFKLGESHSVTLSFWFQDLQVIIRTGNFISKLWGPKKTLLHGVSGKFECGRLAAIMGPSGAGKSTFVSVLLGKIAKSAGTILINGNESTKVNVQKAIGYVPQEDIMLRQGITVRDILLHSAVSRLPSTWTRKDIETKVDETLRVLKLESVQHNFIGDEITRGLSGGERKRLNNIIFLHLKYIGMELVANPVALVLDEPTSGLDTTSAYDIMLFLKQIAQDLNMTIIVVLHQPRHEIYELCDDLLLLGKGGHTTYIGSVEEIDNYFTTLGVIGYPCPEHVNPADHYIDVVSGKVESSLSPSSPALEYLVESWKKNEGNFSVDKQQPSPVPHSATGPFYRQFFANITRSFLQLFRDVSGRLVDNFLHLLAGAIIAIGFASQEMFIPPVPRHYLPLCPPSIAREFCWFPGDIRSASSIATIAIGLAASTIGVRTFFNERPVYWRETGSGLNTVAYFIAKNIVDLVPIFLFTCAFVVVATPVGSLGNYLIMFLLYEFCLYPVGYICTHLSDGNPSVLAVIVALLSGLGTQATGVPFMWSRWASEGLVTSELDYDGQPDDIKPMVEQYIINWKYSVGSFNECILALVLIGVGLRLLAYIMMRITKMDKQK